MAVAFIGSATEPLNVALIRQPLPMLAEGALIPALVASGEVWRLLSSMFLHSGFVHVALNMVSLYFLGSFVEPLFGRGKFLLLYLASGLSGGIAYLYFSGFDSLAVGASGAIFGLIGGIFGFALRERTFSWGNPIIRQLLILLALNLYVGFTVANISNTAHIGGLAGGAVFGFLISPALRSSKRSKTVLPVAAVFLILTALLIVWLLLFA
ncbi:putative membrane protein [Rubrobacter radiotolerans]|uniref:Putative membrane protein n=1 Tax=Rubrobacter radiotolerans TaxID=42256 RepID=A0A023X244_RUBRA|nr:rhomboid family intramembrane serine protease [Rubrobacter radiotolerans]AHY46428.1 putative membrane protein [Rubrobacter radiotolerans]MDX5893835.1 rhomboid family intramembrane serine protease [Rubrobacter radiotolerans]